MFLWYKNHMKISGNTLNNFSILNDETIEEIVGYASSYNFIFFDMDGTILNSEPLHYQIIKGYCTRGEAPTMEDIYGIADENVFPLISQVCELSSKEEYITRKNEDLVELIGQSDPNIIRHKNIQKLLNRLKQEGKKLALVTASQYEVTHPLLKQCELDSYFEIIITEREVEKSKPDPAPYLLAQSFFKANTSECLIFEDSPTGVQAAKNAGIDHFIVKWFEGE